MDIRELEVAVRYHARSRTPDPWHRQKLFLMEIILEEGTIHRLRLAYSRPTSMRNGGAIETMRESLKSHHLPVADAFRAALVTSVEGQRIIAQREARLSRIRKKVLSTPLAEISLPELERMAYLTKDLVTWRHIIDTAEIARAIIRTMTPEDRHKRGLNGSIAIKAARGHDIGKLLVRSDILRADRPLSRDEFREHIVPHPTNGGRILQNRDEIRIVIDSARQHHRRVVGGGYPDEVLAEPHTEIGKLMAVCDSLEAMTAGRYDKPGRTTAEAIKELEVGIGAQFDRYYAELAINLLQGKDTPFNEWWEHRRHKILERQVLERRKGPSPQRPVLRTIDDKR